MDYFINLGKFCGYVGKEQNIFHEINALKCVNGLSLTSVTRVTI